jgi:hypothetical protein
LKNVGPEISSIASTWPIQPIYIVKEFVPETSPIVSTWPVNPIYIMKEVAPKTSPAASTWPVQPIYMIKKVAPEFPYYLHMACTAYIQSVSKLNGKRQRDSV